MLQLVPFQCKANVLAPAEPTAHESFGPDPAMDRSELISLYSPGAATFGLLMQLHFALFQCSIMPCLPLSPTAQNVVPRDGGYALQARHVRRGG